MAADPLLAVHPDRSAPPRDQTGRSKNPDARSAAHAGRPALRGSRAPPTEMRAQRPAALLPPPVITPVRRPQVAASPLGSVHRRLPAPPESRSAAPGESSSSGEGPPQLRQWALRGDSRTAEGFRYRHENSERRDNAPHPSATPAGAVPGLVHNRHGRQPAELPIAPAPKRDAGSASPFATLPKEAGLRPD